MVIKINGVCRYHPQLPAQRSVNGIKVCKAIACYYSAMKDLEVVEPKKQLVGSTTK